MRRVAFLLPNVTWDGADAELRRTVATCLWNQQLDVCMRSPTLSVATPHGVGGGLPFGFDLDGVADREAVKRAFETWRRDEVLWLDVTVTDTTVAMTLHALGRDDSRRSFDALGPDVGVVLTKVTEQWLDAGGLGALVGAFDRLQVPAAIAGWKTIHSLLEEATPPSAEEAEAPMLKLVEAAGAEEEEEDDESSDDDDDDSDDDDSDDDESEDDDDDSDDDDDEDDDVGADSDDELGPPSSTNAQRTLTDCLDKLGAPRWSLARTAHALLGGDIAPVLRELDPAHPWVLWADFVSTQHHAPDFDLLRRCVASAPGWFKPYTALTIDEDELPEPETDAEQDARPTSLEQVAAATFASFANPASHFVATLASQSLAEEGREAEALRLLHHRVATFGADSAEHIELLRLHEDTERIGDWVHDARESAWQHGCPMEPGLPWFPDQILVDLGESDALMQAGRLEEAIQLRGNRLQGVSASWPRHTGILEKWKRSPRFVAWSYAREGAFRGDDARTVEGFGRAEPDDGVDLGLFLDALVATGREREAPLAWAFFGEGHELATPFSRLKAARALFAAGAWAKGLEQLLDVTVCSPRRGDDAERAHVARMLAGVPDDVVTSVLGELLDARSTTLAWVLARELGDFWPGASKSRVVTWGLGKPEAPVPLAGTLAIPGLDAATSARLDAFLAVSAPTLEAADRLVNGWPELVFGGEPNDVVLRLAHVAAKALDHYLRSTLGAPTPACGAFRTVAAEALQALGRRRDLLTVPIARAVLQSLEPSWSAVHPRLAARWLGAVERALLLEELVGGDLEALVADLPQTRARLAGPESLARLGVEVGRLTRARADGWAATVAPLAERLAWETGNTGAVEWANASAALLETGALHEDDALDFLASAAFLTRGHHAEPSILFALACFAAGDGETAFSTLCLGLQHAGEEYRDKKLELLKAPFTKAKLGVPFDFEKAANVVFQALQKGDPVKAERAGRWCFALDPENGEVARNLGLALTAQGRVEEALAFLVKATPEQATQILAGLLNQAGKLPEALSVIDFASRWYVRADQWLTFGGIVYAAMDNPRTVKAYATAFQLDPDAFDTSQLNAYAGVLDEVGDAETCERIARRLIDAAGKDLLWLTNGWSHLACALIGKGQYDEAVKWAKKAVEKNPLPDNTENFAKTLERAKKKQKLEVVPLGPAEPPRHAAYLLAESGELSEAAKHLATDDWNARRAALRASRFRFASDNHTPVTKTARDAAATTLELTTAQVIPLATVCRSYALDLRAEGLDAAIDRSPDLGDRLTRHAFYEEFRARGGVIVGDVPDSKPVFTDRDVFPGEAVGRAAQYVALLKDVGSKPLHDALQAHHLDAAGYLAVCTRWGRLLDGDATLRKAIAAGLG